MHILFSKLERFNVLVQFNRLIHFSWLNITVFKPQNVLMHHELLNKQYHNVLNLDAW